MKKIVPIPKLNLSKILYINIKVNKHIIGADILLAENTYWGINPLININQNFDQIQNKI